MDTFVTETLTAWQLENLIDIFKDQEVDEESFRLLDAIAIASLIPKIGHRVKFQKYHKELISQDFQQLHPEAVGKLFENWATMSDRILTYAQREGKLPLVFDDMTPDRALKVLPILLPPSVYKIGGRVHRPTIEESHKSFINIQPVGTNMVQYLQTAERTQPFPHILCLGDDMTTCQTFTIVSDNAIETDTLLGAVDLCFKAFFVLDLNYTKQCLPTWEFIQQAVYEIDGHESSNVKFLRTSIAALA
ncbi:hypothetical protein KUCAC02_029390 [Chaenocephalus aceratus]|nr:hypothetical protein KUCAC02_029390 [Chaenocephalus aceratus]